MEMLGYKVKITDKMIDAAAVALRQSVTQHWHKDGAETWGYISEDMRNRYRRDAKAALEAAFHVDANA